MTLWTKVDQYSFSYFEKFEDSVLMKPFENLLKVWRSKIKSDRIPSWKDFDFYDFIGWHGEIAIYDVQYDPFDYQVRLSGAEFDALLGRTMKGVNRKEMLDMNIKPAISDEFYEMTCRNMLIALTDGVNIRDRDHQQALFIELPLSDTGVHATHTIEAFVTKDA